MPGRSFSAQSSYRYGFNGKENDNEVKGEGNQQDYGMRIYDPRLGKFLSKDPLSKTFPYWSPYQFSGNNPIRYIDLDGAEQYDPQSVPTGITYITIAKAPGIKEQTKSIWIGNYELRGIWGENDAGYWIARYHYKEGRYKGMYNDEFVVGPDGVKELAKDPEKYHNRAEWLAQLGTEQISLGVVWKNYKNQVSNPVNYIAGAGILSVGAKTIGRKIATLKPEQIVARGINGTAFTETQISNILKASSEDVITLYRGVTGTEGSGGTLFLATTEEYAKSYSTNVVKFQISASGYKRLLNEGLIETKTGINASNGAKGSEVVIQNPTIQNQVLKSKIQ